MAQQVAQPVRSVATPRCPRLQPMSPPFHLPGEIIDIVCLNINDPLKLGKLRLLDWTWHESASRAMFSHLVVPVDLHGMMKLENVAFSPHARFVRSITFEEPGLVSLLSFESDEDDYDYYDEFSDDERPPAREHTGFADDDPAEVTSKLVRCLRRLTRLQVIELNPTMDRQFGGEHDVKYRKTVLDALSKVMPTKLKHFELQHFGKRQFNQTYQSHEATMNAIIGQLRTLHVQHDERWQHEPDGEDKGKNIWSAIAAHGTQQEELIFHGLGRPWKTPLNLSYSFTNLRVLSLQNFYFNGAKLAQLLAITAQTLQTVKLDRIRITTKRDSEKDRSMEQIFGVLAQSKSLTDLRIEQMMYDNDWNYYMRRLEKSGAFYDDEEPSHLNGWWFKKAPRLWNMFTSQHPRDLSAGRDLLHAVNENRVRQGSLPTFRAADDWKDVRVQADWLLKLEPLDECFVREEYPWKDWCEEVWKIVEDKWPFEVYIEYF